MQAIAYSCLDPRESRDLPTFVVQNARSWQGFYPAKDRLRRLLRLAAGAIREGNAEDAQSFVSAALRHTSDAPLVLFTAGSLELMRGREQESDAFFERANRAACNIFLSYHIASLKVASELDVAFVDALIAFQAHDSAGDLFLDPAHPSVAGHRVLGEARAATVHSHLPED